MNMSCGAFDVAAELLSAKTLFFLEVFEFWLGWQILDFFRNRGCLLLRERVVTGWKKLKAYALLKAVGRSIPTRLLLAVSGRFTNNFGRSIRLLFQKPELGVRDLDVPSHGARLLHQCSSFLTNVFQLTRRDLSRLNSFQLCNCGSPRLPDCGAGGIMSPRRTEKCQEETRVSLPRRRCIQTSSGGTQCSLSPSRIIRSQQPRVLSA